MRLAALCRDAKAFVVCLCIFVACGKSIAVYEKVGVNGLAARVAIRDVPSSQNAPTATERVFNGYPLKTR